MEKHASWSTAGKLTKKVKITEYCLRETAVLYMAILILL